MQKIDNESLGISLEQNLCLLNKMSYPQSLNYRSWNFYNSDLQAILNKFFTSENSVSKIYRFKTKCD